MKFFLSFLITHLLVSCGYQAHLKDAEEQIQLGMTVELPEFLEIGNPIVFEGFCSPDGEDVNVSISGANPNIVGPCPCNDGRYTCPAVTYSELPPDVVVIASNGTDSSSDPLDPGAVVPAKSIVTVDDIPIVPGPVTFTGTCSPEGVGTVSIGVVGAIPDVIGPCDCVNSTYSCAGSFTSVPAIAEVVATNSDGYGGPSTDAYGPSAIALSAPAAIGIDSTTVFTGSCSPRNEVGSITIDIPGAIPAAAGPCDCDASGSFSCNVDFTALPNTAPLITATNSEGLGGPTTDTFTPTLTPSVDLNPPGILSLATPVVLDGTCAVDGDDVYVFIAGAIPGSPAPGIGPCPCVAGSFTCPSTTFTSLPASPSLVASNSAANDTENTTTNSAVEISNGIATDTTNPTTISGSCAPNGTGNVSITLSAGFTPATAGPCDCIAGSFSCAPITFTNIPITPLITANETTGANGPAVDTQIAQITPFVDLVPPVITTGEPVDFTGDCLPKGQAGAITIAIPGGVPATAGPCDCNADGKFSCQGYFSSLPSVPPNITATNSAGVGGPVSDVEPSIILPKIDLQLPAIIPADGSGNPIAFNATGTCIVDGSTVDISSVDIITPTGPISCTCGTPVSGQFNCGAILIDGTGANGNYPIVSASINDGVNPVVTDTDQSVIPPKMDIIGMTDDLGNPITGNIPLDQPLFVEGTCAPAGGNIEINNAQMSATSISCPCKTDGTFDCGQVHFSGDDSTIDQPELTGVITDTAGATFSDDHVVDLAPTVTISPPANCVTGVQVLTGTCFPTGIANVELTSTSFVTSPVNCDCHTGFYGCEVNISDCSTLPSVTATVENSSAQTASASGTVGTPEVDLELAGPLDLNLPINLTGSCTSETDPAIPTSFVEVSSANMTPSPVQCDCFQGAFDCGEVNYTGTGNPTFATTLVDDNGATDSDSDSPDILPSLEITLPSIVSIGSSVVLGTADTCTPDSSSIVYSSADMTPGQITCTCTSGVPDCSASPVVFDGTGPGANIPVVNAALTDPSGSTVVDTAQTSLPSIEINAPTDIEAGVPYLVTGTCSPANTPGGVTISSSASPVDFIASSVVCDCNAQGEFECGTVISDATGANGTTPIFDATLVAGGATASGSEPGIMVPKVEQNDLSSIPIDGSSQILSGTCFPIGSTVTVFSNDMDPTISACPCGPGGVYGCGSVSFSGNGPNGNVPEVTASITDTNTGLSASDTDVFSGASVTIDLIGSVDIDTPFNITGDCSPDGEDVTLTSPDITVPASGSIDCPCVAGVFTCSGIEVAGLGPNGILPQFTAVITDPSSGSSASDTAQTNVLPHIDVDPFGPITSQDIITFTGSCGADGDITISSPDMNPIELSCSCVGGALTGCGTATFDGTGPNTGTPIITAEIIDTLGNLASDVEQTSIPVSFACGAKLLAFGFYEDGVILDHDSTAPPGGNLTIPIQEAIPGTYEIEITAPGFSADGGSTPGTGTYTFTLQGGESSIKVPMSYDGTNYGTDLVPGNIYGNGFVPIAISSTQSDPNTIVKIEGTCDAEVEVLSAARQLLGKTAGKYAEDGSGGLCNKTLLDEVYCWSDGGTAVTGPPPSGNPAFAAFDFTIEQDWSLYFDIPYVILPTEWHSYVITDSGKLVAWGNGAYQALGLSNPTAGFNAPRYVSENNYEGWDFDKRIVADMKMDHTDGMALLDNGEIWSWGKQDAQGDVVGNGTGGILLTPYAAWDPDVPGGAQAGKFVTNAIRIAAGGENHCYTSTTGKMFCVGQGNNLGRGPTQADSNVYMEVLGPAGVGTLADIGTPNQLEMISSVATNGMCVLIDGAVYCWGSSFADKYPKLMQDTNGDDLDDVIKISGGQSHACAVRTNGTIWCWGHDTYGELGDGTIGTNDYNTASQVVGDDYDPVTNPSSTLTDMVWVDVGWDISCGMNSSGEVYCWGQGSGGNNQYALGHGGTGNTATPVLFGGGATPAASYFVTYRHDTCVVDANSDAYCAGKHSGDNPTTVKTQFSP